MRKYLTDGKKFSIVDDTDVVYGEGDGVDLKKDGNGEFSVEFYEAKQHQLEAFAGWYFGSKDSRSYVTLMAPEKLQRAIETAESELVDRNFKPWPDGTLITTDGKQFDLGFKYSIVINPTTYRVRLKNPGHDFRWWRFVSKDIEIFTLELNDGQRLSIEKLLGL